MSLIPRCVSSSACRALVTPATHKVPRRPLLPDTLQEHLLSGTCRFTNIVRADPLLLPAGGRGLDFALNFQAAGLATRVRRQFTLRAFEWRGRSDPCSSRL